MLILNIIIILIIIILRRRRPSSYGAVKGAYLFLVLLKKPVLIPPRVEVTP